MNRTCISYWLPKLDGFPVPKTTLIHADFDVYEVLDGNFGDPLFVGLCHEIGKAANALGYPAFLRTGMTSGKHDWKHTCYLESPEQITGHVVGLCEYSHCVDFIGLPTDVWAVREFLHLEAAFHAFEGMPVATEWRFFVADGRITHVQPYWPEGAIQRPSCKDWRERLRAMHSHEIGTGYGNARELAFRVAERFRDDGAWSVDVCKTLAGEWYVTDMAEAEKSYMFDPVTEEELEYATA